MSKELIERLREDGKFLGGNFGKLMHESADALEAKAATVGDGRGHDTKGSRKALGAMNAKLKAKIGRLERELAAHQRQQAREVVMPERKELPDLLLATYHENRGWNACLDEFARLNKGAGSHE